MTAVHAVVNLLAFIVAPKSYGASRQPAEERRARNQLLAGLKSRFRVHPENKRWCPLRSFQRLQTLERSAFAHLHLYYTLEGAHPLFIGIFASAFGVGVLLGSFLVGPLTEKFALGPLGITSLAIASACYLLLPVVLRCCGRCAC